MRIRAQTHWLPKAGNADEDYEDAFYPCSADGDVRVFRCAVADGATETSFSGLWAQLLVHSHGRGHLSARRWEQTTSELRERWRSQVASRPLPWYAEEKLRQGAFSALVGLTLTERRDGIRWNALAIGDSCLFHLRGDELLFPFPLAHSADFNSRPHLLSTNPASNSPSGTGVIRRGGRALPGDCFLLMTDALASWYLRCIEDGGQPCARLAEAEMDGGFGEWISGCRSRGEMRNDDVTLLRVDVL